MSRKPPPQVQVTTLWDYPSQHFGPEPQGDPNYAGVTPSYVVWNLLQRYTREGDLVVDPCVGSGTTLDVARQMKRQAVGFDLVTKHPETIVADARSLPLRSGGAALAFIDPPYLDHIKYSNDRRCLGRYGRQQLRTYLTGMTQVIGELRRSLSRFGVLAIYVSDSYHHRSTRAGGDFTALNMELALIARRLKFTPLDHIAVTRHNKTLDMGNYRAAAERENFFLRGFNHLLLFRKPR